MDPPSGISNNYYYIFVDKDNWSKLDTVSDYKEAVGKLRIVHTFNKLMTS